MPPRRSAPDRRLGSGPPGICGVYQPPGLVAGAAAAFAGPPGAYNLADDLPCSQNAVIEHACRLTGAEMPPVQSMDEAGLSPMARAFYAENRRVANGKAKRVLNWAPRYPDYRAGLAACLGAGGPDLTSSA